MMDWGKKDSSRRGRRLDALLQEVIGEVIAREVGNPHVHKMTSVVKVKVASDLRLAYVYVSVMAEPETQELTLRALQSAAGFISVKAAKKVQLRYFPSLRFYLDHSADDHIKMMQLLEKALPSDRSENSELEN